MSFEPCTLKRHEEGDSLAFQAKLTGAGANDMCNMQELTKDSILNLLKDRKPRLSSPDGPRYYPAHALLPARARCLYNTHAFIYGCLSPSRAFTGFKKEIVYTYVGDIVVSVNPFKNVGAVGKAIRNRCAPPPPSPTLHTHTSLSLALSLCCFAFSHRTHLPSRARCVPLLITHPTNQNTDTRRAARRTCSSLCPMSTSWSIRPTTK